MHKIVYFIDNTCISSGLWFGGDKAIYFRLAIA